MALLIFFLLVLLPTLLLHVSAKWFSSKIAQRAEEEGKAEAHSCYPDERSPADKLLAVFSLIGWFIIVMGVFMGQMGSLAWWWLIGHAALYFPCVFYGLFLSAAPTVILRRAEIVHYYPLWGLPVIMVSAWLITGFAE